MTFYRKAGELIIGTRLKRISDRFLTDVSNIYKKLGIPFEVSWFPLFYLLHNKECLSVTEIAKELQITHSAVSQLVTNLQKKDLVKFMNDKNDKRKRIIGFTESGQKMMHEIKPVWKSMRESMQVLLNKKENSACLLKALDEIEDTLEKESFCEGVLKNMSKKKEDNMKYTEFIKKYADHPNYKAPEGTEISAKTWETEAPLRMLLNNLNPDVAEDSENLVVYGGTGQAARDKESVKKIIKALLELESNQSLLIQSGKPVGIVRTHSDAPRVFLANSNLVPHWATWDHFNKLKEKGLIMYGQMTAGSWIYIGTQGILQGTYETFAACGEKYFNGNLKGKLLVTGGLGAMGGAQPLAATMAGATFLGVDMNPDSIKKRIKTRYIDRMTHSYEEAKKMVLDAQSQKKAISVGLVGNIGNVLEKLLKDNIIPDVLTDQTSAHDPVNGYIPAGLSLEQALMLRKSDPDKYRKLALKSMARHVSYMLEMKKKGSRVFDYGNNLREFAKQGGEKNAFDYPGFVPEYIRPQFCEGKGPFRWAALSGDPQDIYETDQALIKAFPENKKMINWIQQAQKKVAFQGLPCRICWLGLGEREKAGLLFNDLVKSGKLKAPVVIGRDHLDGGSVASPYRETEGMKDGSDAVSDWPLLNLMANTSGGATWVSFHHGGGVGIGYSQHAGMVLLVDGTERSERCIRRVLFNDPATAIFRHADAGYEKAVEFAKKFNLNLFK